MEFQQLRNTLTPEQLKEAVPKQSFWSDIAWAQWKEQCRQDVPPSNPAGLKYILHDAIDTPNTKYIMEQAVDPYTINMHLDADWPRVTLPIDSRGGLALLGTAHGTGAARILFDHRQDIRKKVQKVTVWTSGRQYYLLFHLS